MVQSALADGTALISYLKQLGYFSEEITDLAAAGFYFISHNADNDKVAFLNTAGYNFLLTVDVGKIWNVLWDPAIGGLMVKCTFSSTFPSHPVG